MLDFVADNYMWFIILGTVLLVIALILLFSKKKPIKDDALTETVVPNNSEKVEPGVVEVTGNTETLEIVDDVVEEAFVPQIQQTEVVPEVVEEKEPFVFEMQSFETANNEVKDVLLENTVVEPLIMDEVSETIANDFAFEEVSEASVTEEITFEQPTLNNEPTVVNELANQFPEVPSMNVGDVVIPLEEVNTDNVQVNNEQEDIWRF